MSEYEAQKLVLGKRKAEESMDPSQALWMGRWKLASCNQASQVHQHGATHGEIKDEGNVIEKGHTTIQIAVSEKVHSLDIDKVRDDISIYKKVRRCGQEGLELSSDVSQSGKQLLTETKRLEIEKKLLTANSGKLISPDLEPEQFDSYIFRQSGPPMDQGNCTISSLTCFGNTRSEKKLLPKHNFSEELKNFLHPTTELAAFDRHPFRHHMAGKSGYNAIDTGSSSSSSEPRELKLPATEIHLQGLAGRQGQQIKPYNYLNKQNSCVRWVFQEDLTGSTSNSAPSRFKPRGLTTRSYANQEENNGQPSFALSQKTSFTLAEHEHSSYQSCYAFLASCEMDKAPIAKSSQNPCARKKDSLQPNDNSITDDLNFPFLVGEQGRVKTMVGGLQPSYSGTPAISETEDLQCRHDLLQTMPLSSLHDVETFQISTMVNSMEGVPGCPSKLSKTTQHLLITKTSDVNLSTEDHVVKESTASAERKGISSKEMIVLPSICYSQGMNEAKLKDLGNSTDSEENENGNGIKTNFLHVQNESSAETNAMSLDVNQNNFSLPGAITSPLHKNTRNPQEAASTSKEVRTRSMATKLPDINKELPAESEVPSSVDDRVMNISRTESLDAEHLLSHIEQPDNSNSSPHHDSVLGPAPSSRWVKRLRSRTVDPVGHGTKSLKICDASSSRKVNNLFSRITSHTKMSSESLLGKDLRNRDSSSMDSMNNRPALSASNSWIQRWSHRRQETEQARRAPPLVMCEPESLKTTLEEIQKKQFPSIAAMALMGKAVSNFRPCEFRKSGSLVVWNTEGFENLKAV